MRALSAQDVLRIWERGQAQRRPDRAITLLAAALPEMPPEVLADLPLGRRDGLLLRIREQLFGPALAAYVECPQCRARLEFTLGGAWLHGADQPPPSPEGLCLWAEGCDLRFRLPTSRDLSAVIACADVQEGRALLRRRCVLEASRDGVPVPVESLPESATAELAGRMEACDPQAEMLLDLACPACGRGWQASLDIAGFVWVELAALARRLLGEVHALARAYGWPEADILAMSAVRRQRYLEMAG